MTNRQKDFQIVKLNHLHKLLKNKNNHTKENKQVLTYLMY